MMVKSWKRNEASDTFERSTKGEMYHPLFLKKKQKRKWAKAASEKRKGVKK